MKGEHMTRRIIAVVVGAFVANLLGAVWYMVLQAPWMAASGVTMEQASATPAYLVFLLPLCAWLVAGLVLNFLFDRLADTSLRSLLTCSVMVWLGGAMVSVVLSTFFGGRGAGLVWIDGGYILVGLVIAALSQGLIVRR